MSERTTRRQLQYGALPFRTEADGKPSVLLITSRGNGGWIIPKGWPIPRLSGAETATREAFEEAGLIGTIVGEQPFGVYEYAKRAGSRRPTLFEVSVFLFEVRGQRERWPERGQRTLAWLDPEAAIRVITEPSLALLVTRFAETFRESHRILETVGEAADSATVKRRETATVEPRCAGLLR